MTRAKKIIASVCAAAALITAGTCTLAVSAANGAKTTVTSGAQQYTGKMPKYIFMFIGDGMSFPQTQITADYYSALADTNNNDILEANRHLNFR